MSFCQITFCGLNVGKILCYLAKQNICLLGVERQGNLCAITVKKRDAKATLQLLKQRCITPQKVKYFGASHNAKTFLQRHFALVIAMMLFVLCTMALSNYCCKIVISGDFDSDTVRQQLGELSVQKGANLSKLNLDVVENSLANNLDAMYAVVTRKGCVLYVNVLGKKVVDTPIDMHQKRDIVATVDGVVLSVLCEQGSAKVCVGQRVKKGDILIEGLRQFSDGTTANVYAIGKILLEQSVTAFAPYTGTKQVLESTGLSHTVTQVVLFGKTYGKGCRYKTYTSSYKNVYLYPLNLCISRVTYEEMRFVTVTAPMEECIPFLQQQALFTAQQQCDFPVSKSQFVTMANGVYATLFGYCEIS